MASPFTSLFIGPERRQYTLPKETLSRESQSMRFFFVDPPLDAQNGNAIHLPEAEVKYFEVIFEALLLHGDRRLPFSYENRDHAETLQTFIGIFKLAHLLGMSDLHKKFQFQASFLSMLICRAELKGPDVDFIYLYFPAEHCIRKLVAGTIGRALENGTLAPGFSVERCYATELLSDIISDMYRRRMRRGNPGLWDALVDFLSTDHLLKAVEPQD